MALGDIDRALWVAGVALLALDWLWWRAWFPVDVIVAAAVCVAGVALGDINRHFARQATWIVTLHGRRGTYGTGPARLALVARLVPVWRRGRRGCLRGRRGTWRHRPRQDRPLPLTYTHGVGMPVLASIHAYMHTHMHT